MVPRPSSTGNAGSNVTSPLLKLLTRFNTLKPIGPGVYAPGTRSWACADRTPVRNTATARTASRRAMPRERRQERRGERAALLRGRLEAESEGERVVMAVYTLALQGGQVGFRGRSLDEVIAALD